MLERWLLELSDQAFMEVAPEHARQLKPDQPAQTGVKWIDELERQIYKKDK